jgi:hypothetical protein
VDCVGSGRREVDTAQAIHDSVCSRHAQFGDCPTSQQNTEAAQGKDTQ